MGEVVLMKKIKMSIMIDEELSRKVRDLAECESRTISNQIAYMLEKQLMKEKEKEK